MRNVAMSWSSGKDSALTLYQLKLEPDVRVQCLVTTLTEDFDRVVMHSTRKELLFRQAKSLGLSLRLVYLPTPCSNENYESEMAKLISDLEREGIQEMIFGDLYLEEVKNYRCQQLSKTKVKPIFPLWKKETRELAERFISLGFKAYLTCIDSKCLDSSYVGRPFDKDLLNDLPDHVDPCGENGEFHTFVYDGPIFSHSIRCAVGEKVERDGFWFADVLPL